MDVPEEGEEGYVGWIVDLKICLASWSLRSDMVGRSARKMALVYGISCAQGYIWCRRTIQMHMILMMIIIINCINDDDDIIPVTSSWS